VLGACLIAIGVMGFAAYRAGSIEIEVHERGPDGTNIAFSVPSVVVESVIHCAPRQMLDEMAFELDAELGDWRPFVAMFEKELRRLPDCVLVRVASDDEHVRIEKRGGRLVIEVESDDEHVRVAVPIRMIGTVANKVVRDDDRS
jgi:hypothetical protein